MAKILTSDEVHEVKKGLRTVRDDIGLVEYALAENIARVQQLEVFLELRQREQTRDAMVAKRDRDLQLTEPYRGRQREREKADSHKSDRDPTPKAPATPIGPVKPWSGEPLNGKTAAK